MRAWQGLLRGFRRSGPARADCPVVGAESELLLRVLCHEFRTPVSTLASVTRALTDDRRPLSGDERRALNELARDQAGHLQNLLRDAASSTNALLLATRPEATTVPLGKILRGVALLVPDHRRRIRVTRRAGACPVPELRTRQVLVNLVDNALRHGPTGGQVGVYAALRRGGLRILVTDEGWLQPALFEAIRRPAPGAGTSGLGLWIVRQLVTADRGRMRVLRLHPRGVALEILLPGGPPTG
ncbi:HAMP domain-containing sensor histidine kinase [Micromonospora sp. WMMA1363]|uniref:sensor histidine kinase n=1 Tax=Micromonospora sp. WMMA1363 TaxID=3053985 RepID=UPI00259D2BDF|nr:HAMP domain-containing sensor histidine kinase [Micromonospora sp. WMMA1363]MDM4719371.1 HAMP domain-containing sensor histidine kinase [Micromonospora sp. WMMA1363]